MEEGVDNVTCTFSDWKLSTWGLDLETEEQLRVRVQTEGDGEGEEGWV